MSLQTTPGSVLTGIPSVQAGDDTARVHEEPGSNVAPHAVPHPQRGIIETRRSHQNTWVPFELSTTASE